jgi:hypothetical protein
MVYRSLTAPLLGEVMVAALRVIREQELADVRVGPKSIPFMLETGVVLDGPDKQVKLLDAKLQAALRLKKIPFIRRTVSVIRPDMGPPVLSSAPPSGNAP